MCGAAQLREALPQLEGSGYDAKEVRSFGARRLYAMLQRSVRPCQQWIRQLDAKLRRAREDCRALVIAFGEEDGERGPKMEHAAQQLLQP